MRILVKRVEYDLPFLLDLEIRILVLAMHTHDVATYEPAVLEFVAAEVAYLLAALDIHGAFSRPDVVMIVEAAGLVG